MKNVNYLLVCIVLVVIFVACNTNNPNIKYAGAWEAVEGEDTFIITSDSLATGDAVYAGYDVTTDIPYGNVVVEDGGTLMIKANETTLTNGVEVKLGGTLIIEK